jgi:hypothetical protein
MISGGELSMRFFGWCPSGYMRESQHRHWNVGLNVDLGEACFAACQQENNPL